MLKPLLRIILIRGDAVMNTKNTGILLIILSVIACFVLSGCWLFGGDAEIEAAVAKGDISMCDELNTTNNPTRIDNCYAQVAAKIGDESICPKIDDARYKDSCYKEVGIKNKNSELCKSVKNEFEQENCFSQIAIAKKDKSICNDITNSGQKTLCLYNYAKATNDVKVCKEDIQDSIYKDECFRAVGIGTKSDALCKEIVDEGKRNDCYYQIAIVTDGNLLCNKITTVSIKDDCFLKIALARKDAQQCSNIEWKSRNWYGCIRQVAVLTKDESVCKGWILENPEELKSCTLQVNNAIETAKASESED